jgi:glyoxylase-like metal-dependent hydrolase (beta-lactamase superfamily II)
MIEKILENLYKIEIPLTGNPLKALNAYVIKAPDRNLIIDTGWNREDCMNAMMTGLREIDVDLRKTDFFITHFHVDHIGLIPKLLTNNSKIYFNQPEADRSGMATPWERLAKFARLSGFPEDEIQSVSNNHPGYKYGLSSPLPFTILKEKDTLRIGDYQFRCVETPGHTWGSMCLYEPNKKIFVSGDHILSNITPNIQLWSDDDNPLKEYLASLDKVREYSVELVLPGHRYVFRDYKKRIQELKFHHRKRLNEILSFLGKEGMHAYHVASLMTWDIAYQYDSWDLFPVAQKWFATGEAIAHLKYLEKTEMIRKENQGQKILF